MTRRLIVNADDFGSSEAVNAGVAAAHDDGIVTSASLMVRQSAVGAACELARQRPRLSLGLHVDLGEWVHVAGSGWVERYAVVDAADTDAVAGEVEAQVSSFIELVGRPPTHLDGHQHIQRHEPTASVLRAVAERLGVPLRLAGDRVAYRGDFYGQGPRAEPYHEGVAVANLVSIIASVPDGWTELGCHPGLGVDPVTTVYALERELEVAALCAAEVQAAVDDHGVVLASFADLD